MMSILVAKFLPPDCKLLYHRSCILSYKVFASSDTRDPPSIDKRLLDVCYDAKSLQIAENLVVKDIEEHTMMQIDC